MIRDHPEDFVKTVAALMPKSLLAEVNKTEIKATISLTDVLGEMEVLSERLGYELKPRKLPHNLKVLDAQAPRLPLKSNGES